MVKRRMKRSYNKLMIGKRSGENSTPGKLKQTIESIAAKVASATRKCFYIKERVFKANATASE